MFQPKDIDWLAGYKNKIHTLTHTHIYVCVCECVYIFFYIYVYIYFFFYKKLISDLETHAN